MLGAPVQQRRDFSHAQRSYEKIRDVIEKRIFSQVEDLLPVISFGSKKDGETEKKHGEFVNRTDINRPW
jgi:predicted Ser/Thr protein kinase